MTRGDSVVADYRCLGEVSQIGKIARMVWRVLMKRFLGSLGLTGSRRNAGRQRCGSIWPVCGEVGTGHAGQESATAEKARESMNGCLGVEPTQWHDEQCEEVQPPQPEEPMEVTVFPPLEKPNLEMHFRTFLLLHLSHDGNGASDRGKSASKL